MNVLIGYREEDWNQCWMSDFQMALNKIEKLQMIFDSNFIEMR